MSVTRNYARHLRVITVLQTFTLQLRIVTRKVRNYAVMTHFTHLQRNAGSVTRNSHTLATNHLAAQAVCACGYYP